MSKLKLKNTIRRTKEEIIKLEQSIRNAEYWSTSELEELHQELSDLKFELIELESEE